MKSLITVHAKDKNISVALLVLKSLAKTSILGNCENMETDITSIKLVALERVGLEGLLVDT